MRTEFSNLTIGEHRSCGRLWKEKNGEIVSCETPCLAIPTLRGLPKVLLWEEIDMIFEGPHNYVMTIPLQEVVSRYQANSTTFQSAQETLELACRKKHGLFVIVTISNALCSTENVFRKTDCLYLSGYEGRFKLNLTESSKALALAQVDFIICPSDDIRVTSSTSKKREKRSLEHSKLITLRFLPELFKQIATLQVSSIPLILLNAQGGSDLNLRTQFCEELTGEVLKANESNIGGIYIGGLNNCDTDSDTSEALQTSCKALPPSPETKLLRMTSICGTPYELLEAVWYGIDIIELGWFPFLAAEKGFSFHFEVKQSENLYQLNCLDPIGELDRFFATNNKHMKGLYTLDLRSSTNFASDPHLLMEHSIVPSSRAYIHHLLNCNEMLGTILLTKHNLKLIQELITQLRSKKNHSRTSFAYYILWFYSTQLSPTMKPAKTTYLTPYELQHTDNMRTYTAQDVQNIMVSS